MKIEVPRFEWKQEKWATARTENVEDTASAWGACPNLVRVFSDRKFGQHSLVMLQKEKLEQMVSILHDVQHGEVMVRTSLEALFNQVQMVVALFEQSRQTTGIDQPFALAIRNLTLISGQVQSVLCYVNDPKPIAPAPLGPEELEQLKNLGEE